jgi:AcrR family transcriptional regulator
VPSTTRDKLLDAAAELLTAEGPGAVSARAIATRADVNQALVFYHFGTVSDLLEAAVRRTVDRAVASYDDRFRAVQSLGGLLDLGRDLQQAEQSRGNVAQMAHVLAGAQSDEVLARAGRYAMERWSGQIEEVLVRLLPDSPLDGVVEASGLARAIAAGAIGLELYAAVDEAAAQDALATLDVLAALMQVIDGLGPVTTRVVRGGVRKAAARGRSSR